MGRTTTRGLKPKAQRERPGEYGQTAGITRTLSYSMTVDAGPNDLEFCIVKQNFWREKKGFCLSYMPDGFAGLQTMVLPYWSSGSRESGGADRPSIPVGLAGSVMNRSIFGTYIRLSVLWTSWVAANPCLALGPDGEWSVTHLDPCGYVSALDAFSKPLNALTSEALLDLENGRYESSWRKFLSIYRKYDASPGAIWGLAMSARKAGKLDAAIEEVIRHAIEVRRQWGGQTVPSVGHPRHIVAFNLVQAMDVRRNRVLTPNMSMWWSALSRQTLPSSVKNREMIILYAGALHAMSEHGKSRELMETYLASHPKDSRCLLLLARICATGVVRIVDAAGRDLPVPPSERGDMDLARKYAVAAVRIDPKWSEAQYLAGVLSAGVSRKEADRYLREYLRLDRKPDPRRVVMIEHFLKTGKWGLPPPGRPA